MRSCITLNLIINQKNKKQTDQSEKIDLSVFYCDLVKGIS